MIPQPGQVCQTDKGFLTLKNLKNYLFLFCVRVLEATVHMQMPDDSLRELVLSYELNSGYQF